MPSKKSWYEINQSLPNGEYERAEKGAAAFIKYLNTGGDQTAMALALACQHNTLQQMVTAVVARYLTLLCHEDAWVDGRNEASVAWAKKVVAAMGGEDQMPRGFPFI